MNLPKNVWLHILKHSAQKDLYSISVVCRNSNKAFRDSRIWQGRLGNWKYTRHNIINSDERRKNFEYYKKHIGEWNQFQFQWKRLRKYRKHPPFLNEDVAHGFTVFKFAMMKNNNFIENFIKKYLKVPKMVPHKFYTYLSKKKVFGIGVIGDECQEFAQCEKFNKVYESRPYLWIDRVENQMPKKHNTMVLVWAEKRLKLRSKQTRYFSKGAYYNLNISKKDWRFFDRIWPYRKEDLTSLERLQLKYQSN